VVKGWNTFAYTNRLKVFLFKYYNILGTGHMTAHFVRDSNPACIFCEEKN